MPVTNPVTDNEFIVRLKASERAAVNRKKTKAGLTYTQFSCEILAGTREPLPAPARKAKHDPWTGVKIYPSDEWADLLIAKAEECGVSVGKIVRAAIFLPNPATPVKAGRLRVQNQVPEPVRAAMAELRATDEFSYTKLMSESTAFVEIAGVLMLRESKVPR